MRAEPYFIPGEQSWRASQPPEKPPSGMGYAILAAASGYATLLTTIDHVLWAVGMFTGKYDKGDGGWILMGFAFACLTMWAWRKAQRRA